MSSKNQYLTQLRKEYLKVRRKKQRGVLLNEAEKRTKLCRKYLTSKLKPNSNLDRQPLKRKPRKKKYDGIVKSALVVCWRVFDRPCGQRLEPLLKQEVERLRRLNELVCSSEIAKKLKTISPKTIDNALKHQIDRKLDLLVKTYQAKNHSSKVALDKKQKPFSVRKYITEPDPVSVR